MQIARLGIIAIAVLLLPQMAIAKRAAPNPVAPVVGGKVRYMAPDVTPKYLSIYGASKCFKSGNCLEARDRKTSKLLWQAEVYQTKFDPNLETDVQSVYINSIEIDRGKLIVKNERGDRYSVDLKTHAVKKM
jgi:hypothetical protein